MAVLLSSRWYELERLPDGVVLLTRTEEAFGSLEEIDLAHAELDRALAALPRARLAIVVDLRRARSRNDPSFERAMAPHRQRMFEGFARRAIVVKSAVGRLNVQRHARHDGHEDVRVFLDTPSALAFAREA